MHQMEYLFFFLILSSIIIVLCSINQKIIKKLKKYVKSAQKFSSFFKALNIN